MRLKTMLFAAGAATAALTAFGFHSLAAKTFSLKDPKGVNTIQFRLDGRIEQMTGHTTGISGDISFDPENPEATSGKVVIDASTIKMANPTMTEHLHSAQWIDVEKYPEITFEIVSVNDVEKTDAADATWTANVAGDFTMHGVTKRITIPVSAVHLPGQLPNRNRVPGDLLVLRSQFDLSRKDFNINTGSPVDVVSDTIHVTFSVGSFAPNNAN